MKKINQLWQSFTSLFFPDLCICCGQYKGRSQEILCVQCDFDLPRYPHYSDPNNNIKKLFAGRLNLTFASAYLVFRKNGSVQQLLHQLKYKGNSSVGLVFGERFGTILKDISCLSDVDYLLPVPLHPKKELTRGYNQSEVIANGMSKSLGIPVLKHALIRKTHTATQTKKRKYERWENVEEIFALNPKIITENKHFLIVDDVLTTGATLEACARPFQQLSNVKLSVAVLSTAHH